MVSPDGVAPSQIVCVSASVNLPLHHKVQKFSSGTGSPGWSRKKGRKTVVLAGDPRTSKWSLPVFRADTVALIFTLTSTSLYNRDRRCAWFAEMF